MNIQNISNAKYTLMNGLPIVRAFKGKTGLIERIDQSGSTSYELSATDKRAIEECAAKYGSEFFSNCVMATEIEIRAIVAEIKWLKKTDQSYLRPQYRALYLESLYDYSLVVLGDLRANGQFSE